jgi:hypothetical protein
MRKNLLSEHTQNIDILKMIEKFTIQKKINLKK